MLRRCLPRFALRLAPAVRCTPDEVAARVAKLQELPLTRSPWDASQPSILSPNPHDDMSALLAEPPKKKTLVLDLDETLGSGWPWVKRPHVDDFMECAAANFDIVFWTRSPDWAAAKKVETLGFSKRSRYDIISGWSETYLAGSAKDLKRLQRPMDQILLVDDDYDHLQLQPRCHWAILPWRYGDDDTVLRDGVSLLERVAEAETVQAVLDGIVAADKEHFARIKF